MINDLVLLSIVGIQPVLVHGGGPEINIWLNKLGIEAEFKNGLRVTDGEPAVPRGDAGYPLGGQIGRRRTALTMVQLGLLLELSHVKHCEAQSISLFSHQACCAAG